VDLPANEHSQSSPSSLHLGRNGCAGYLINPKRIPRFYLFFFFLFSLVVIIHLISKNGFVTYFLAEKWYNWGPPAGDAEA